MGTFRPSTRSKVKVQKADGTLIDPAQRDPSFFSSGAIAATGPVTAVGLLDGSRVSLLDFHFVFAAGSNMTLAVEGTNDPTAAIGDAPGTKGWTALTLHSPTSGARVAAVRNSGRQLLLNPPRSVRLRCTAYVTGSCAVEGMAKPLPDHEVARYVSDQDGLARLAMTTFGQMQVAPRTFLIGGNFDTTLLDSDMWEAINANGGAHVFGNGVVELHTGTDPAGRAGVRSLRVANFLGAVDNVASFRVRQGDTAASADHVFRFGVYDDDDGTFIQVGGNPRAVADAVTTISTPTVTSATAAFDARDLGQTVVGTGIPAGATIIRIDSPTQVTISANATASGSGVSITMGGPAVVFVARKAGVDTTSAFGTIGIAAPTNSVALGLWEVVFNPNFVLFRQSNNLVQLLLGGTLASLFDRYDLPLSAEAINFAGSTDHVLYAQTMAVERLGQQSGHPVEVSPVGVNSFDTENGSPIPTNAAPWLGTRESIVEYVQQTVVFDRAPMDAFGVIRFTYAKTKSGTASVENVELPVVAGLPFIPKPLATVGAWYKVDFIPDAASPAITSARLATYKYKVLAPDLTRLINQEILSSEPVKNVRAVVAGEPPDTEDAPENTPLRNLRASGRHSLGSTTAPLPGNTGGDDHVWRGKWFPWQATGFLKASMNARADVAGTAFIDFSQESSPVDGDDSSIDESRQFDYDEPGTLLRQHFVVQSKWVRPRYVNGLAAQSEFSFDAAYLVADPGLGMKTATQLVGANSLVGMVDAVDSSFREEVPTETVHVRTTRNPDTGKDGKHVHLTGIDVPMRLRTFRFIEPGHINVGPNRVQIPPPTIEDVQGLSISNLDADTDVFYGDENCSATSLSDVVFARGGKDLRTDGTEPFFLIAADTGAVTAQGNRFPASTANNNGVVNPNNVLADDAARATFDDQGDNVQAQGFTAAGVQPDIQSITLKVKARKAASPTTEQVVHEETQTGSTTGAGSIVSASLAGGSDMLYLVAISRNAPNAITAVAGAGLTFQPLIQNVEGGGRRLDIWYAFGDATAGAITVSMSTSTNAHIAVSRYSKADPTTPIEDSDSATGTSTTATPPSATGTDRGVALIAVSHEAASGSAGALYTERSDETNGVGVNVDSLGTETKPLTTTGAESGSYNLASSELWLAAIVTIRPAPATDPVLTVTYKVGAEPTGPTAVVATVDSTSDTVYEADLTGDRTWVAADIAALVATLTATTLGAADLEVNAVWLDITEVESDVVAHVTYVWVGGEGF